MELSQLRTLVHVAELGSLSKAADRLRGDFAERVLRAGRGPSDAAWRELHEVAGDQLRLGNRAWCGMEENPEDRGLLEFAFRRGGKPAVLFVHGWPVSGATFRGLLPHLLTGVGIVTALPGTGSSDRLTRQAVLNFINANNIKATPADITGGRRCTGSGSVTTPVRS